MLDTIREQSRQRQPDPRAERPHGDVAETVDSHHQHRERPQLAQIQHAPRIDGFLGQQRQDHERGRSEDQSVAHFLVGEHVADPVVNPRARHQDDRHDDRQAARDLRLAQGETAEQQRYDHCYFGREPGIVAEGPQVTHRGERADDCRDDEKRGQPAELEADGAGECDQSESADAGGGAARSLSLAAFAFDADEQPDRERGAETNDQLVFHTCFRCPMTSERMFCTGLRSHVKHGGSRRSIGQPPVRSTSSR